MKPSEDLAACAHEIWAHWMRYLFSVSLEESDGVKIPRHLVDRWKRQMETPYAELSEKEKESDREQAIKMMRVFLGDDDDGAPPPDLERAHHSVPFERTPDGFINNCALVNGHLESECQICNGNCPDRDKFSESASGVRSRLPVTVGAITVCPCGYVMRTDGTSTVGTVWRCRKCGARWSATSVGGGVVAGGDHGRET